MARRRAKQTAMPREARALLVLVLAAVAVTGWYLKHHRQSPPTPTPAPTVAADSVRIATWNLKHFALRPGLQLATVASIINDGGFDIVAIQEVKKEGEAVDRLLNTLGPPWRGTSFSPMTGNYERFVFIYRGDRVVETMKPRFVQDQEAGVFDRTPYLAGFRCGNFDFLLLSVHLSYTDVARRQAEARALARIATRLVASSTEKDLIVVGDFNEEKRRNFLSDFDAMRWSRLIGQGTNLSGRETYDNILIDPTLTREYSRNSGVVKFDETRFDNDDKAAAEQVSDHRPAWADFATDQPDDD